MQSADVARDIFIARSVNLSVEEIIPDIIPDERKPLGEPMEDDDFDEEDWD